MNALAYSRTRDPNFIFSSLMVSLMNDVHVITALVRLTLWLSCCAISCRKGDNRLVKSDKYP